MNDDFKNQLHSKYLEEHPEAKSEWEKYQSEIQLKEDRRSIRFAKVQGKLRTLLELRESKEKERLGRFIERRDSMISDYCSGMTLDDVGKKYHVTRERVRQIIKSHPDSELFTIQSRDKRKVPKVPIVNVCNHCQNEYEAKNQGNKYCSVRCKRLHRIKYPELIDILETKGKLAYDNARMKRYYHAILKNRPDWKSIVSERNKRLNEYLKNKGYFKSEKYKAESKENGAKMNAQIKEWRKSDPERYRKYLDRRNITFRFNYWLKKAGLYKPKSK